MPFAGTVLQRLADLFLSLGILSFETLNCHVKDSMTLEKLYGEDQSLHGGERMKWSSTFQLSPPRHQACEQNCHGSCRKPS